MRYVYGVFILLLIGVIPWTSWAQEQLFIVELGSIDTPGDAGNVAVVGDLCYVADFTGDLRIINVSDPTAPYVEGSFTLGGQVRDVAVNGDYAYLAMHQGPMVIVDISDPTTPQFISDTPVSGDCANILVDDTRAFIAAFNVEGGGNGGLFSFDVSEPLSPSSLASFQPGNQFASGLAMVGNRLFLADRENGLYILDAELPNSFGQLGFIATPGSSARVFASGDYAYVSDWTEGLRIIDVSDPAQPEEIASHPAGGDASDCAVGDGYAFVVGYFEHHLRILDINDPSNPVEVGSHIFAAHAPGVAYHDSLIFVANGVNGLSILNCYVKPDISLESIYHDFGNVYTDSTATWYLRIENTGDYLLSIDSVRTDSGVFSCTMDSLTIEPGALDSVLVQFAPEAALPYSSQIHIYSNDPDEPLRIIYLEGEGTNTSTPEHTPDTPADFHIGAWYPNPFNATVNVEVQLAAPADIRVAVYDILGRQVRQTVFANHPRGRHRLEITGDDLPSGVYFVRTTLTGHMTATQKVILLR